MHALSPSPEILGLFRECFEIPLGKKSIKNEQLTVNLLDNLTKYQFSRMSRENSKKLQIIHYSN
jgi:uncharacterized protein YeeX (DUF496 family)